MDISNEKQLQDYSEEIQDIITSPPSWLLKWGIGLFFVVLIAIILMSGFVRYPDIIRTQLKINSANSPKPVVSKRSGTLVDLMVKDGDAVLKDQPLAFLESTANHRQVLEFLKVLKHTQEKLYQDRSINLTFLDTHTFLELGEIQPGFQNFYQAYLDYKPTIQNGFYNMKRKFLQGELSDIVKLKDQMISQRKLLEREYELAEQEFKVYEKLAEKKVIAPMELKREESKYIAKKYPLQQVELNFISNITAYSTKEKEILELDNEIVERKSRFFQALSSLISEIETWKSNYVFSATESGKLGYSRIIQKNQHVNLGQEIFYINPGNPKFFGDMTIPQFNMGKIKIGQSVLVKLKSYPYEEYGIIHGKIDYLSDVPLQDSIFFSRVAFNDKAVSELKKPLTLKNGMTADAEIITEDISLLSRFFRTISKMGRVQQ